jgi:superfamily II DNA or RNA helicase
MINLRPYQSAADAAACSELRRVRSTLVTLATGLGKTITAASICSRAKRPVLWLTHRQELLDQPKPVFEALAMSVGVEQGSQRVDPTSLPRVTLASVATLKGKRLERFGADAFGLVVIDEVQHVMAKSWRAIVNHFPNAKLIGLSATPWREDGQELSELFESTAFSMSLGDGISQGWLSPLELVEVAVDRLNIDDVKIRAGDFATGQLEEELLRDGTLHAIAKPLADLIEARQTIAFTPGVQRARGLATVLAGYGVRAVAVDGGMNPKARKAALDAYRSGAAQVLCNAMLVTEGTDLPDTACIALARPTRSKALKLQMIGRGTRLAPGKANCLVIDFVPGQARKALLSSDEAIQGAPFTRRSDVGSTYRAKERERAAAIAEDEVACEESNRRMLLQVGVEFAVTRLPLPELFRAAGVQPNDEPATERQMSKLERLGIKKPQQLSKCQASFLVDAANKRRERGLCTYAQAKFLAKYGYPDTTSIDEAKDLISRIIANGYRPIAKCRAA